MLILSGAPASRISAGEAPRRDPRPGRHVTRSIPVTCTSWTSSEARARERQVLESLLHYGPGPDSSRRHELLVVPRFGTVSPWSSKGRTSRMSAPGAASRRARRRVLTCRASARWPRRLAAIGAVLHDRMTESVLRAPGEAEPFRHAAPSRLHGPLLADGVAALERANAALGLACRRRDRYLDGRSRAGPRPAT